MLVKNVEGHLERSFEKWRSVT